MNGIGYFEIQADDPARAQRFYEAVFGWRFEYVAGHGIDYWQIDGGGVMGGLLPRPAPVPAGPSGTNAFTCSMMVEDFDATAAAVLAAGGIVALDKFAVFHRCWQGYFLDTEGNTIGVFEPDETAE